MNIITIPHASPSLNGLMRWHWGRRKRYTAQLESEIAWLAREAGWKPSTGHEHYTITRVSSSVLDHDNLVGGLKLHVDALVRAGFALDDSPKHITITYQQRRGKPAVLIEREQ